MKRNYIYFVLISFLIASCSGVKQAQKQLATGNYNTVINDMVAKLQKGKTKKKSYEYILLLEDAFKKVVDRDQRRIKDLKSENTLKNAEDLYQTYLRLERRQALIRPLLPLYVNTEKRDASFDIVDYSDATLESKNHLSKHLYDNAMALLNTNQKQDAREAYDDLEYLERINPTFKNIDKLLDKTHFKGTDFILVYVKNASDKVIPKALEDDLLNIESYKLNTFWSVYQNSRDSSIKYDYDLVLSFNDIQISPERIKEKEITQEKEIKDGFEYVLDSNGNVKKDSLGNDIKRDKFITVRSRVSKFSQFKTVAIQAEAVYYVTDTDQVVGSFPIVSQFVFEHHYARHKGNKKALNKEYLRMIRRRRVPFPTTEELIYETGEDIKRQLKNIIRKRR